MFNGRLVEELEINQISIRNGKKNGLVIVIDVFRACSTIVSLLYSGARRILMLENIENAKSFTDETIIFSELLSNNQDNSPTRALQFGKQISKEDSNVQNPVAFLSGNLSPALFQLVKDNDPSTIFVLCCFLNIDAVCEYIIKNNFEIIKIVAVGHVSENLDAIEDLSCSRMLEMKLNDECMKHRDIPFTESINRKIEERKKQSNKFPDYYFEDLDLCLSLNLFPVVPILTQPDDQGIRSIVAAT